MDFSIKELDARVGRKCNPKSDNYMTEVLTVIDEYIDSVDINEEFYIQQEKLISIVENRELILPAIIVSILAGAGAAVAMDYFGVTGWFAFAAAIAIGLAMNFLLTRLFARRRMGPLYPYIIKRMQEKVEEESLQELL